jgi:hypothetical protein
MGFAATFQFKGGLDVLLKPDKITHIWREGLSVELVVKVTTTAAYHVLEPAVVVLLHQITLQPSSKESHEPIIQECLLEIRRALELQECIEVEHISHVVLVRCAPERENEYLS